MIKINEDNFGVLAICAIRYCHGRQTYMPTLIQGIVGQHLEELSDRDLWGCMSLVLEDYGIPYG